MMSVTNLNALQGLAPMTALGKTDAGKAALASNFTVTGDIQSGQTVALTVHPRSTATVTKFRSTC
jgi:hypothetical protein